MYGLIQAKLELITHAYFKGRDFSQVALLEETYKTLNMSLTDSLLRDSQVFLGTLLNSFSKQDFANRLYYSLTKMALSSYGSLS